MPNYPIYLKNKNGYSILDLICYYLYFYFFNYKKDVAIKIN